MTHQCPRPECSRTVPDELFACRGDWYALPNGLRDAIWQAHNGHDLDAYARAVTAAIDWYRANPPRYARAAGMVSRRVRPR